MSPKQKKLAGKAPPPNKIDEKDFAVLRAEKAKGRGMGLQDEKVKPGKVQKAFMGLAVEAFKKAKKKGAKGPEFLSPLLMLKRLSGKKRGGGIKIKKDPTKTVNPFEKKSSKFMERRKALGTLKSSLKVLGKAGKVGAMLGAVGAAGAGAAKLGQTLGRKMSENKNRVKKKMGGGMIAPSQRPGYSKGTMIMARGCKLGRKKATKIT